jgi:uncharacterized protein (DUF488 family)
MTVHTIGHSARSIDEFIALLQENGVRLLVDVRRHPGSRLYPQFNSETLAATLAVAGIAYRHVPDLGGRRQPRADSPNTAWENAGFRGYADHMDSAEFRAGLATLLRDAERGGAAIMCAEAVPWRCHRNLLADALVTRGVGVIHILDKGSTKPHALHEAARVRDDGTVYYPGRDPQLGLL